MEDGQLIELYWQRNPDAISKTAGKYGAYCFAIAENILHSAEDSEECVRRFMRALPERDGNVMARRYFFAESVADIAKRYGLSENNVMVILSRTRKKLKAHLLKEGYL